MGWKETFRSEHGRSPSDEERRARKAQKMQAKQAEKEPSRVTLTVQLTTAVKANGRTKYETLKGATDERKMFVAFSGCKPSTMLKQIRSKVSEFFGGTSPPRLMAPLVVLG